MANSLTFNDIDLGDYGLVVTSQTASAFRQIADSVQLPDVAYPFGATREAKSISLEIAIIGTSYSDVKSKLDSIKRILNERDSKHLKLDNQSGRYWNAQFVSLVSHYQFNTFIGALDFICADPLAYDDDETSSTFDLDVSDPKTVTETTGGTGYIKPVYTLTAGEALNAVTIKVECLETVEELQWTGSLADGEVLEIDVDSWLVRKEGSASMATVTGQFPRLLPTTANRIKVTGFGVLGSLNVAYRDTYL